MNGNPVMAARRTLGAKAPFDFPHKTQTPRLHSKAHVQGLSVICKATSAIGDPHEPSCYGGGRF